MNIFEKLTKEEIQMLIELGDADGVWAMLQDFGDFEGMDFIEENYFEQE